MTLSPLLTLEIVLTGCAAVLAGYFALVNIVRRSRFVINRVFALISFITLCLYLSLGALLVAPGFEYRTELGRLFFLLILGATQLFFHLTEIFPRWEKRSPGWFIALSALPGLVLAGALLFTDAIVVETVQQDHLAFRFGRFFIAYIALFGLYIFGSFLILLYKSSFLRNQSFRVQIFYMFMGTNLGSLLILVFTFMLPIMFNVHAYKNIAIAVSGSLLLLVINYALSDERMLDFKRFYLRGIYWVTVFALLVGPVYAGVEFGMGRVVFGQTVPAPALAFGVFLYLFVFYRSARPRLERFFQSEYRAFERNVLEFFQELSGLAGAGERGYVEFFNNAIDMLEHRFGIARATFLTRDRAGDAFEFSYSLGERISLSPLPADGELARALVEYAGLIDRSMIFTDERLAEKREELIALFDRHDIQVAVPLFDYEKRLIGVILTGSLVSGRPYNINLLQALELYRIQFELTLANAIMLDEVKRTQAASHDRLVVRTIKGRIIPRTLAQIDGIRLSSLYKNVSERGGDYFDAVAINPDTLGIFIADTADLGVESGLLGLELYAALRSCSEKYEMPEQVLGAMNWVVCTSRYSEKYAQALSVIFSSADGEIRFANAAFNPLAYFDSERGNFIDLDTKGVPIGIERGFSYESGAVKAHPDSIGVMYSNGLVNARNRDGASYTIGRVKDLIRINRGDSPAVLARRILADFEQYTDGTVLTADVSLVVFKIE